MALTLGLCSGLCLPASAQTGASPELFASIADTCFSGESLLVQLTIGGTDRGVQVVYLGPGGQLWLPLSALMVSERSYGGAAQDCEGERYVPLQAEVGRELDRLGLTLELAANYNLLGISARLLQVQPLARTSDVGLWQVRYALSADGSPTTAQFTEQGELEAQYLRGPLSAEVEYQQRYSGAALSQRLNAQAQWQASPQFSAGVFNRPPWRISLPRWACKLIMPG